MKIKNLPITAAALGLVALAVAVVGPLASAENGVPVREANEISNTVIIGVGSYQPNALEAEDLAALMESDPSQADRQNVLQGQTPFVELANKIESDMPETFVSAGLGPTDIADAWISFTSEPTQEILDAISDLPLAVDVRWGYPASQAELATALDYGIAAAGRTDENLVLAGWVTPEADAIEIEYRVTEETEASQGLRDLLLSNVHSAIAAISEDGQLPVPVRVEENPDLSIAGEDTP